MLIITLGDPFSINVEAITKSIERFGISVPIVLVGNLDQWRRQSRDSLSLKVVSQFNQINGANQVYFLPVASQISDVPAPELSAKERGQAAVESLTVLKKIKNSNNLAVLTCPIDKFVCQKAGFGYPGQTEFFEALADQKGIMVLAGPKLRVGLVTNHLALSNVASSISKDLIVSKAKLFVKTLRNSFAIASPRVCVTGLNPHCGDSGLFGKEEIDILEPAIDAINSELSGTKVSLQPADTAFFRAYSGEFDGVLAMYHDQGLGPLKTVHFYDAINITGGLKFLRVSPDHGPAADKFALGTADFSSFFNAFNHCIRYLRDDR